MSGFLSVGLQNFLHSRKPEVRKRRLNLKLRGKKSLPLSLFYKDNFFERKIMS